MTQLMEVGLDESTMALYLRPRTTDTRYEGDVFAVCLGRSAVEVEQAARQQLVRNQERPVTPFDPGSYTDVLTLAARNLDNQGAYRSLPEHNDTVPPPGEHLVVTDAWALFVRPRSNNYLLDDLYRLKQRLVDGCDIPEGPAALVTVPSDEPVPFTNIQFRGLSSRGGGPAVTCGSSTSRCHTIKNKSRSSNSWSKPKAWPFKIRRAPGRPTRLPTSSATI